LNAKNTGKTAYFAHCMTKHFGLVINSLGVHGNDGRLFMRLQEMAELV
jgi:hypothetical protein